MRQRPHGHGEQRGEQRHRAAAGAAHQRGAAHHQDQEGDQPGRVRLGGVPLAEPVAPRPPPPPVAAFAGPARDDDRQGHGHDDHHEAGEVGAVDERAEGRPALDLGSDPVEPVVPGDALDDAQDGDQGAHPEHRPEGALGLRLGAVRVVADHEEGGDGGELQPFLPRDVRVEGPAGHDGLERDESQEEERGEPARGKLHAKLPMTKRADHVHHRHAENHELHNRSGPRLDGAEGEGAED